MGHKSPSAAATDYVKDGVEDLSRKGCTRGRPGALGAGRWGSIRVHSASERSV